MKTDREFLHAMFGILIGLFIATVQLTINEQEARKEEHTRFTETCIRYELSEAQCDHLWLLSQ